MNSISITPEVEISFPNTPRPKPKPEKRTPKKQKKIRVNKATKRKHLILVLDRAIKEIVLDRDLHCVCEPPSKGHSDVRQPGHLISRGKESVRWSLSNVHEQCSSCNLLHEFQPHRYTNWFLKKFGQEKYDDLCKDADTISKLQLYELEEMLCQFKKIREKQLVAALSGEPFKPYFSQKDILSGAWDKNYLVSQSSGK